MSLSVCAVFAVSGQLSAEFGMVFDPFTALTLASTVTSRVRLGTNILQLSARTPVATAMAALTLDHLSGGRFVLGLGASGPPVVEGWYGQPYPRPLARTRAQTCSTVQACKGSHTSTTRLPLLARSSR